MVGVAGPQAQRLTLQVGDGMCTASSGEAVPVAMKHKSLCSENLDAYMVSVTS